MRRIGLSVFVTSLLMLFMLAVPLSGHAQESSSPQGVAETGTQGGAQGDDARALIQLLQDPGARQALIDYLQRGEGAGGNTTPAAGENQGASAPAPAPAQAPAQAPSDAPAPDAAAEATASGEAVAESREASPIALRIAEATQHLILEGQGYAERILRAFTSLPAALSYSSRANWDLISGVLMQIAFIGAALLVSVYVLRRLADRLFARIIGDGQHITVVRRAFLLLLRAAIEVLVARDGPVLLGFAAYGPSRDDDAEAATLELYAIYVAPCAYRQGIGRRLWQTICQSELARNAAAISLWVLKGNHAAQRFYQALGLTADGHHRTLTMGGMSVRECRYVWPATRVG